MHPAGSNGWESTSALAQLRRLLHPTTNRGCLVVVVAAVYFKLLQWSWHLANGTPASACGAWERRALCRATRPPLRATRLVTGRELDLVDSSTVSPPSTLNRPERRNVLNGELIETMAHRPGRVRGRRRRRRDHPHRQRTPRSAPVSTSPTSPRRVELRRRAGHVAFPESPVPPHTKPHHRRGQRRRGHRRARARAGLRLPGRLRAGPLRRHPRPGRRRAGWGLTVPLPEAVGVRRAKEMSVTGNFIDAATALDWGLVNHVVPHDELLPFCRQLGRDIASNDSVDRCGDLLPLQRRAEMVDASPARRWNSQRFHVWHAEGKSDAAEIERRRAGIVDRRGTRPADAVSWERVDSGHVFRCRARPRHRHRQMRSHVLAARPPHARHGGDHAAGSAESGSAITVDAQNKALARFQLSGGGQPH